MKIRSIVGRPVALPMKRPLATGSGKLTEAALLLIDLQTEEGIVGRSYAPICSPWAGRTCRRSPGWWSRWPGW
jgi:mandelate racemase